MITLRPLPVSAWPEPSPYPSAQPGRLYLTADHVLVAGSGGLLLQTPRGTTALGVQAHAQLAFSLDAADPDRLILCNTTEVWEVRLSSSEARRLLFTGTPLAAAISVPGAVLALVSKPWTAVQRWEAGPTGELVMAWETPVPRMYVKMSVFAEGRGLLLHDARGEPTLLLAVGPDGLRGVATLGLQLSTVRAEGPATLVVPWDAGGSWHALEGYEEAIAAALDGPRWETLRDVALPHAVVVLDEDGAVVEDDLDD
jgi:hypothetical protein